MASPRAAGGQDFDARSRIAQSSQNRKARAQRIGPNNDARSRVGLGRTTVNDVRRSGSDVLKRMAKRDGRRVSDRVPSRVEKPSPARRPRGGGSGRSAMPARKSPPRGGGSGRSARPSQRPTINRSITQVATSRGPAAKKSAAKKAPGRYRRVFG